MPADVRSGPGVLMSTCAYVTVRHMCQTSAFRTQYRAAVHGSFSSACNICESQICTQTMSSFCASLRTCMLLQAPARLGSKKQPWRASAPLLSR